MKRDQMINRRMLEKARRDAHQYGLAAVSLTKAQLDWIYDAQKAAQKPRPPWQSAGVVVGSSRTEDAASVRLDGETHVIEDEKP